MTTPLSITMESAVNLVAQAQVLRFEEIQELQRERLLLLLEYARTHSPYLKKKYSGLPQAPALCDIPVTLRSDAVAHFDEWVCDPEITSAGLNIYLSDIENAATPFLGKYTILTTSGTTGRPLRMVCDNRHNLVNAALMSARLMGGSKLHGLPLAPGMKAAGVLSSGGYHSTYLSYLRTKKAYEQMGCPERFLPLFLSMSTAEMVKRLNEFQPEMLTGYPSNMKLLALEQQKGRLHIAPIATGSSAEYLSPSTRELIETSFGCPMIDNYCSTEGGELAMLCSHNRMHINADWAIVEPVDHNLNPVPYGQKSEGVLLTNLANLVQPIIRYYISDKVIINPSPCPCGLPFPSLEIEGRLEDNLTFLDGNGKEATVTSSVFIMISLHVPGCDQVQFIQTSPNALELRYVTDSGREEVGRELAHLSRERLDVEGLANVVLSISKLSPILGASGKMRNTISLL